MSKKNSSVILKNQFKDYKDLSNIYSLFSKKIKNLKKNLFLVAVSGGPDSLALTALIKSYSLENTCKVYYVLIDHNLRKNSSNEAKLVKNLLKKFKINLNILKNKKKIVKNIQSEALANMSDDERKLLAGEAVFIPPKEEDLPKAAGPGKIWNLQEVITMSNQGLSGRNFENGKKMFAAAKCLSCHRFDGAGGSTGPDLSNAAGRFSNKDLAEAIIHPSKVISDQYRAMNIVTVNGQVLAGRVTSETEKEIIVLTDPVDATKLVTLAKDDIDEMFPSKQSLMPEKLLNTLNQEEVLDLLAFLMSRGNPNAIEFK